MAITIVSLNKHLLRRNASFIKRRHRLRLTADLTFFFGNNNTDGAGKAFLFGQQKSEVFGVNFCRYMTKS